MGIYIHRLAEDAALSSKPLSLSLRSLVLAWSSLSWRPFGHDLIHEVTAILGPLFPGVNKRSFEKICLQCVQRRGHGSLTALSYKQSATTGMQGWGLA
jgi:hypothetical protein